VRQVSRRVFLWDSTEAVFIASFPILFDGWEEYRRVKLLGGASLRWSSSKSLLVLGCEDFLVVRGHAKWMTARVWRLKRPAYSPRLKVNEAQVRLQVDIAGRSYSRSLCHR
jgi:hypothetical protein